MKKTEKSILWFSETTKNDIALAGGKGANLGEMYRAKIPVPNGFIVTSSAYYKFLKEGSLREKIKSELRDLDIYNSRNLNKAAKNIQTAILSSRIPLKVEEEIKQAYLKLCGNEDRKVAVRSSATAEDLPDASFAGQQETYLNVLGYKDVIKSVQKCWASLFGARAIFYRQEKNFNHFKVGIAVPVQLMVDSYVSGIMFTVNPITNNRNEISIEAAYGLGQPIVSGELIPDQYLVSKEGLKIIKKIVVAQEWQLTDGGKVKISRNFRKKQKLADKYIKELARIGKMLEDHYNGVPQDIEWALEGGKVYIVQTRPVTTLKVPKSVYHLNISTKDLLLSGLGASPGVVSGPASIIKSPKEIGKVRKGSVLVTEMTDPDYVPAMRKACAIVTDKGGRNSHAAIVSRELGIPAVVGTDIATKMLKSGEVITVDGTSGKIYSGNKMSLAQEEKVDVRFGKIKTATKIYVNLGEPYLAEETAARNVDGVGLLRAEFIMANIGRHPRSFIKLKKEKEFIKKLSEDLGVFAKAFNPRPVVYRTSDFKTNEYENLKGGYEFEKEEENPLLGFRGVRRYIADPAVFAMEVEAIKLVRNKMGYKNLHIMLPFVRTVDELKQAKKLISALGLRRSHNFKLWMMVEIPSNVILLEDFIDVGIDGISVGSNDLTMLTLGVDRDNARLSTEEYCELNEAVLWSLERVIKISKKRKITASICGQAPSIYPSLVKKLVRWGITSISVNPDAIEKTRKLVYEAELDIVRKK